MSNFEIMFGIFLGIDLIDTSFFIYNTFNNVKNNKYQQKIHSEYFDKSITLTKVELNKMLNEFLDKCVIEQEKIKQKTMNRRDSDQK